MIYHSDKRQNLFPSLFLKHQINRRHQKQKSQRMVPLKRLAFEGNRTETDKDNQRNHLLDHLQLDQVKRPAIIAKTHPVGRDLETIFT